MFTSARWRADKNKITALFKLRFHATQVSQLGGNALVLSLVPADTGRPTAKLDKFEIRDGCCYWENPIFETVKLIQDHKTGKIQERVYYFIISTGSSKLSILGEVSVNIAEYAGAIEAASVSLPFKGSNSDVILHVLIQRIQENVSQREFEVPDGAIFKPEEDKSLRTHFRKGDSEESISINSSDEQSLRKTITNTGELNRNRRASIGSDITLSSSDSSSGLNTPPRELGMKNGIMLLDSVAHNQGQTGWELSLVPIHDSSTDDSTNSPRNVFPNGRFQLAVDSNVDVLKSDLVLLSRKAEVADLELQTLRKQIVKESRRGQDLLKEVAILKEERDVFKEECEKLQASSRRNKLSYEEDPWALLEETREELNFVKDLNVNLQLQLQKTQESNSELILAVQDLEQILQQGNSDTGNYNLEEKRSIEAQGQSDDDEEQKALEEIVKQHTDAKESYVLEQKIMDLCSEVEMYRRDKDELEIQLEQLALDYEILKQENHDMTYKLDKRPMQEQMKLQYECSSSYAIINELETRVQKLERELKERSNEFEGSLATIKGELEVVTRAKVEKEKQAVRAEEALGLAKVELKNRTEKLEDRLKKKSKEYTEAVATIRELADDIQILEEEIDNISQGFESDLEAVMRDKVEQEQRAIRAEEALRVTRWKNANTAGRLQDEFKRFSMQMHSTFESNEKLATKVKTEASELQLTNKRLEDLLQQAKEELQSVKNDYEAQVVDLHDQLSLKATQIEQLNHQRKHKDEVCQSLSAELLTLRAEMDRLTSDTASLVAQIEQGTDLKAELEQVKALVKERDFLVQRGKSERENLEDALVTAKRDAQKSLNELNAIRCLKNEKDMAVLNLQSEVDILRAQCEELRHSLYEDEFEMEKLSKQVIQLEDELKKKDNALTNLERERAMDAVETKAGSEEAISLKEHIQLLEVRIKQKETALETSENTFIEKEKDLHDKIEELEKRLCELDHSSTTSCEYECRKGDEINGEFKPNGDSNMPQENGNKTSINKTEENGMKLSTSTTNSGDQYTLRVMLKEMASLSEKNASMESELKEMQERYSEISLRFAEVEGERQKLMMTVRSIKNSKKR